MNTTETGTVEAEWQGKGDLPSLGRLQAGEGQSESLLLSFSNHKVFCTTEKQTHNDNKNIESRTHIF